MTQDRSKKTLRQFQCRDYLWDLFEQMSAELECSTDYLINEAMRQYARSRNYSSTRAPSKIGGHSGGWQARSSRADESRGGLPSLGGQASSKSRSVPPAFPSSSPPSMNPSSPGPAFGVSNRPTMMPHGSRPQGAPPPPLHATYESSAGEMDPTAQFNQLAGQQSAPPSPMSSGLEPRRPPLYIIFQGKRLPVNNENFLIGRGTKSTDLSIKDGNISRRHAAIVFQDGAYYVKDLGSTNGVEYRGQRIDIKRIEEGDVFNLCEYELRFTFR